MIQLNRIIRHLSDSEWQLVQSLIRNNQLKGSTPSLKFERKQTVANLSYKFPTKETGQAVYLWKKLAYMLSPIKKDSMCPPDSKYLLQADPSTKSRLDEISDLIIQAVPRDEWYGKINRGEPL